MPVAHFPETAQHISGLLEIADDFDTFVFDAFGVLNVGDTPIAGAVNTIESLRAQNKRVFLATNAASYSRQQSVVKFQRMGFDFAESEIVTSRMAAERALSRHAHALWGVIASDAFAQSDLNFPCERLTDQPEVYDRVDGFLFLSTQEWSASQQLMLERSLSKNQRP
ncbi:MAG: haloacid dehalogenase, partial [Rhizobiaceae bacterium]|nr:haloacid dehalogenase [Rhizobiaceae bacterium]